MTTQLMAAPAFPDAPEQASQFEFLIGEWDCEWTGFNKEGEALAPLPCRWSARYTFDGRMVQDDYRLWDSDQKLIFSGTTLRSYSPDKARWEFVFLGSQQPAWPRFHGRWEQGEMRIHAEGTDRQGRDFVSRIKFHKITSNSFEWRMDTSYDGGETWQLSGINTATRR
jgi:hypothetical protein